MKKIFTAVILLIAVIGNAQVAINTNGDNPASSAMLDVSSSNKGMLMPRMTTAQRKTINSPETGLLVFDTDRQTIYLFDGQKWKPMMTATESTAPLMSRQAVGANAAAEFGYAADIYEDYAVVGAPRDTAKGVEGGAAYIFAKNNGLWTQIAKISAPFPISGERFGKAVSISDNYLVVGDPNKKVGGLDFRGAIYVFKRVNRSWQFMATLTSSNGTAEDYFGTSVCINGNYIVAGAPFHDHSSKNNAGSVYVFGLQNNAWAQKAIVNANDPYAEAKFGTSLDLWQTTLVVGAPGAEAIGFTTTNGGAAYVFNNTDANGFTWMFNKKLTAVGYTHNNMKFGSSVAIEADKMAIGAPDYSGIGGNDGTLGLGALFRFAFENGNWTYKSLVTSFNEFHKMGTSVALTNGIYLAGMPGSNNNGGKVLVNNHYVYDEDPNLKCQFGKVVAAHNGQFLITAPDFNLLNRVFFGVIE